MANKYQYVGYEKSEFDGKVSYKLYILKPITADNGYGIKPITKRMPAGGGVYFPKVKELPTAKVGSYVEVTFNENGYIESIE